MTTETLANGLGLVAGTIWMSAAVWFQMVRSELIHPGLVAALCLIGVALTLASSAVALSGSVVLVLAVAGNGLFLGLGLAAWYLLDRFADREQTRQTAHRDHPSR